MKKILVTIVTWLFTLTAYCIGIGIPSIAIAVTPPHPVQTAPGFGKAAGFQLIGFACKVVAIAVNTGGADLRSKFSFNTDPVGAEDKVALSAPTSTPGVFTAYATLNKIVKTASYRVTAVGESVCEQSSNVTFTNTVAPYQYGFSQPVRYDALTKTLYWERYAAGGPSKVTLSIDIANPKCTTEWSQCGGQLMQAEMTGFSVDASADAEVKGAISKLIDLTCSGKISYSHNASTTLTFVPPAAKTNFKQQVREYDEKIVVDFTSHGDYTVDTGIWPADQLGVVWFYAWKHRLSPPVKDSDWDYSTPMKITCWRACVGE